MCHGLILHGCMACVPGGFRLLLCHILFVGDGFPRWAASGFGLGLGCAFVNVCTHKGTLLLFFAKAAKVRFLLRTRLGEHLEGRGF